MIGGGFGRLPPVTRGVVWMTGAATLFACTFGIVRHVSAEMNSFEIAFFRSLFGVAFMVPWLMRSGFKVLRTTRPGLYGARALLMYSSLVLWFYGLANMNIADATALYFTTPLFTVVFAAILLGEKVGIRRWTAIVFGFAGALVIIRPGLVEPTLPVLAVLVTAVIFGATNTATRSLAMTENPSAIVTYALLLQVPLAIGPAIWMWSDAPLHVYPWLIALGGGSVLTGQCFTRAFAAAPTSAVMPPYYLQLPFAAAIGFVWFDQVPDGLMWIGAAIICASTYYIAWRETVLARRAAAA